MPLFFRSRNYTGEENGIKLVSTRAPPDFEQNVLSRFQAGNNALVLRNGRNVVVVDFRNDVAANEADILGKTCRIDLGHQNALHVFEAGAACAIGSEIFDAQSEFNRGWPVFAIAAVRCAVRENLGAIRDRQTGVMLFLIANVRNT